MTCIDIPVSLLMDSSSRTRGDLLLSLLNEIRELEKLQKDISHDLAEKIGQLRSAEWLEAKREEILDAVRTDLRQMRLDFPTRQVAEVRQRTKTAA